MSLSPTMLKALERQNYLVPSPVQRNVIPKALRGASVLAQSATGSGKTHAYLIPLIEKADLSLTRIQALVICPTRELARQTYEFAVKFCQFFPKLRVRLFTSETDLSQNVEGKEMPPQIAIGTPGRLKDLLLTKRAYTIQNLKRVVLDEADMLMDMGYFEDIEAIVSELKNPQLLVFSATLKQNLKDELKKFVKEDFDFEGEKVQTAKEVSHHLVDIKHAGEKEATLRFLKDKNPYLALVFCSKKETVNEVYGYLKGNGIDCLYYSGDLTERERKRALKEIRANIHPVIVTSDLLSRGIDLPDVTDVISVDLPTDLEFYYHRAGRAGRFGKVGDSWVFYNRDTLKRPRILKEKGLEFDFYSLKGGVLTKEKAGLLEKERPSGKKPFSEAERKEIMIAKSKASKGKVEPMHKKKKALAIEKVKRKYKRKAIKSKIREQLDSRYKKGE